MSVDACVTGSTSQVLVLTVWNVKVSLWIAILFGKTKVDDIDLIATLADAHEKVVRLDIAMNEALSVNVLDA